MRLGPRELDKLMLHQAGFVAQKRLARGCRLNHPESVALVATQIMEFARDGRPVAELMDLGRRLLGRRQVMAGVPEMVTEVQVEATFPDGTKLVTVHHPIASDDGDLSLALYGSFLPVPPAAAFFDGEEEPVVIPGEITAAPGSIELNAGREAVALSVTNLADRPIQVGSHFHFAEANPYLRFDRARAYGRRLDVPAGMAVRFEPGETRRVQLIDIAGERVVHGGSALASGAVSEEVRREVAARARARGFAHEEEAPD